MELVERHLELNPDDLRALGLGSGMMIGVGRPAEGLAMAERSIRLAPDDASVLHNAACAFAQAGNGERALDLMERRLKEGGTMYRTGWSMIRISTGCAMIHDSSRSFDRLPSPSERSGQMSG